MFVTRIGKLACAALVVAACSTDLEPPERSKFLTGPNSVQVDLFDGITGVPITGGTMSVTYGSEVISGAPNGDGFLFERIPGGEAIFQASAQAQGYADFAGVETLEGGNRTDIRNYLRRTIALYQIGTAPSNLEISVFDSRTTTAVSGAQVVATFDPSATVGGTTFLNRISGESANFRTVMIETTGSDGRAIFGSAQVINGATYSFQVYGAVSGQRFLQDTDGGSITVGRDFPQIDLFLSEPSLNNFIFLSANNENNDEDPEADQPEGLILTSSFAFDICTTNLNTLGAVAEIDGGDVLDNDPVSFSFANEMTQLTIRPNIETTGDANLPQSFRFTNFRLSPEGADDCVALSDWDLASGGKVSPVIRTRTGN